MNEKLIKELELLKFYKEKGCLDLHYKLLIDYIDDLETENKELHNKIDKAIEITHKILMNNADNRMICTEEEEEYFDWLDKEMLEQEKILKGSDVDE